MLIVMITISSSKSAARCWTNHRADDDDHDGAAGAVVDGRMDLQSKSTGGDLANDPVAAPVRYLVGHARLSASWTLLWSSRSASILSAQNCIKSTRSGRRSSRS